MQTSMPSEIYQRLKADVIDTGLCTHCGTCVGLSRATLKMQRTPRGPLPTPISGRDVYLDSIAYDACPGRGVDYPALCTWYFDRIPSNWLIGCYRGISLGYSSVPEVRERASSGGLITQSLIYLLEEGIVDGAVVLKHGSPDPWLSSPMIATTADEVLEARQSVYIPTPVNTLLDEMSTFPGRLAYVGLPDQVASLRRLQQLEHPGALKVDYVLGPYVGTMMYLGAIESYLRSHGIKSLEEIESLRYREGEWPGSLHIVTRKGRVLQSKKFYYNYLIPFFITRSTLLSVDFTNELTDLSIGDAWHPELENKGEGYSIVVTRSEKGERLISKMEQRGLVHLEALTIDDALTMHGHMIDFKKRGSFVRADLRVMFGRAAPAYGYRPEKITVSRRLVEVIITGSFLLAGTRLARRVLEWFPVDLMGMTFERVRSMWKRISKPTKRKGLKDQGYIQIPLSSASYSVPRGSEQDNLGVHVRNSNKPNEEDINASRT
jgi:coenzyme F420 hydrogenase subunit beta